MKLQTPEGIRARMIEVFAGEHGRYPTEEEMDLMRIGTQVAGEALTELVVSGR